MSLESIANYLEDHQLTNELFGRTNREDRLILTGASRTAKALITTSLAKHKAKTLLVIVPTLEDATRWYPLVKDCGWNKTCLYPTSEVSPYESIKVSSEIVWGQLQVLGELVEIASLRGREVNKKIKLGICGEHGGDPRSIDFCSRTGLNYVSCSPYRVPIARLAAAQAYLKKK